MFTCRLLNHCYSTVKHSVARRNQLKIRSNPLALTLCCKHTAEANMDIFTGKPDIFNGVTVDLTREKCQEKQFTCKLEESLKKWCTEGKRCIWFKVNITDACHIPVLAQKGFTFHHARDNFVMMYKWLPTDCQPNLPPSGHINLGVGAMVFNADGKLLAVSEKNYDYPHWKLPGGYVERGEELIEAAIREVREETGVECAFESLVTFRHTHNMMYGNSDIYVLLRMKATNDNIKISTREVRDCKWMEVEEYTNHPHVHAFNKLIIQKALEYKNKNIILNIEKKTVKFSKYTRDMHFLLIENNNN